MNKFDLWRAFINSDRIVWSIMGVISIIMLSSFNVSLPVIILALACAIVTASVLPGYYKLTLFPVVIITVSDIVMLLFCHSKSEILEIMLPSHLGLLPLALSLVITMASSAQNDRMKVAGVGVVIVLNFICMMIEMSYAVFTSALSILAMVACGLFRRQAITYLCMVTIMSLTLVAASLFFGRTAEDRLSEGNVTENVINQNVQIRLDRLKERIVNGPKQREVKDTQNRTSTIIMIGLYLIVLSRVIVKTRTADNRYKSCLAICCSIALLWDALYIAIVHHSSYPVIIHFVMLGTVLACLRKCDSLVCIEE